MGDNMDVALVVTGCLLLRSLLTSHQHSGQSQPPMFGDYEAQRHWQEITVNLPTREWYRNSSRNDLLYWGLDYPPLTAYHSLALGYIAEALDPEFVKMPESRGTETELHKIFMRNSVLLCDAIFLAISYFYARSFHHLNAKESVLALALLGLFPGLILIDNGHFQYNNVSLGLFILAVALVVRKRDILASIAFVCALNYKQMELYHALPFFSYLLGKCLFKETTYLRSLTKLIGISVTVIITFAFIWLPFVSDLNVFLDVVARLFPVSRGIFEDKVANFWCTLNIIIKIKHLLNHESLVLLCFVATLIAAIPANIWVFLSPNPDQFLLSLINTSFAFFLFSFQVHEKSILLVAIPVLLYAGVTRFGRYSSIISVWFLLTSTLSMWPLLARDCLTLPTITLSAFYFLGCEVTGFLKLVKPPNQVKVLSQPMSEQKNLHAALQIIVSISLTVFGILVLFSLVVTPQKTLPDLWPVLISAYSSVHFVIFWIYFNHLQFRLFQEQIQPMKKNHAKKFN